MSASVNEREEPAPAWQKCEKHHITFGMARCPMCAEDDAGYSKSRSPLDQPPAGRCACGRCFAHGRVVAMLTPMNRGLMPIPNNNPEPFHLDDNSLCVAGRSPAEVPPTAEVTKLLRTLGSYVASANETAQRHLPIGTQELAREAMVMANALESQAAVWRSAQPHD